MPFARARIPTLASLGLLLVVVGLKAHAGQGAAVVQLQLGQLLVTEGRYADAAEAYERAWRGGDRPTRLEAGRGLLVAWLRTAEFRRARDLSNELVALAPADPAVIALRGDALWAAGQFDLAEARYRDALTLAPGQPRARNASPASTRRSGSTTPGRPGSASTRAPATRTSSTAARSACSSATRRARCRRRGRCRWERCEEARTRQVQTGTTTDTYYVSVPVYETQTVTRTRTDPVYEDRQVERTRQVPIYELQTVTCTRWVQVFVPYNGDDASGTAVGGSGGVAGEWVWRQESYPCEQNVLTGYTTETYMATQRVQVGTQTVTWHLLGIGEKILQEKPGDPRRPRLEKALAESNFPLLAQLSGVKVIHISERDTQVTDRRQASERIRQHLEHRKFF